MKVRLEMVLVVQEGVVMMMQLGVMVVKCFVGKGEYPMEGE